MFRPQSKFKLLSPAPGGFRSAFTLMEILVVISIISILASLLLPVLASGKSKGQRVACFNNLKQLGVSAQMYSADNDGKLVENLPATQGTNTWVQGNIMNAADATNQELIRHGKLFPYASQVSLYHCPSDLSQA